MIQERKRFLVTSYLMRRQDDLENTLRALYQHFQLVKLTSTEELSRNNPENLSAAQLIEHSNKELNVLLKQLQLNQMDEEEVRYDVFNVIYDMIFDNIDLRVKLNKMQVRVLDQGSMNIDKTVVNFFRRK